MKLQKTSALLMAAAITFSAGLTASAENTNIYPDVNRGDWFYPYVKNVSEQGLMTGYKSGDFGVTDNLTRGQFATVLWRIEGAQSVGYDGRYPDVEEGIFYAAAAKWAGDNNIITGYENGYFGGEDEITREQVATILSRYAAITGKTVTKGNIYDFPDGGQVADFAKDGVADAVGSGWITGDNGCINPKGTVSRAVSATLISRYTSDFIPPVFESMPEQFVFTSGAGGWQTELILADDGTFTGEYYDSDMGDTGSRYPNGTVYICNFSGSFTQPEQVNDYTYKMNLESLQIERTPEETEYRDGVRYIYSEPYGLDNADEFYIYTPGAPVSDLPYTFVLWTYALADMQNAETLPCYGIYNEGGGAGFIGMQ